ncbi:unnamed protein product [Auanema sp. JU1783]|nr:unnamed protein product [Auanema sp. JU1783]
MLVLHHAPSPVIHEELDRSFDYIDVSTSYILSWNVNQDIDIEWNLSSVTPNMMDWIGIFDQDTSAQISFLDSRQIGLGLSGSLKWSPNIEVLNHSSFYFAYINGLSGVAITRSAPVSVTGQGLFYVKNLSIHGESREITEVKFTIDYHSHKCSVIENGNLREFHPFSLPIGKIPSKPLIIEIGKTQLTIPLRDITTLTRNLNISIPTGHQSSFTVVLEVEVMPFLRSPNSTAVSPSISGSSMSQASTSSSTSNDIVITRESPVLPNGWEACKDENGRIFYIDHKTKRTTWRHPTLPSTANLNPESKRYSMARRTIGLSPPPFCSSSAQLFLQRDDFISLLHEHPVALAMYNSSPLLKHMIHRIRKCGDVCEKFEGQKDFVQFVNHFADTTQPLPPHWQASGKSPTTLLDPRLPTTSASSDRRRGKSAPPIRRHQLDNNGNMLDIVNRTKEIASVVEKRMPELAPKIRKKLRLIERLGHLALSRMANDVDLIMAISILEADDPVTTSEMEEKLNHFYTSLHRSGYGKGPQKVRLRFSRQNLLKDAFEQILNIDSTLLKKARLSITFDDEDGLDYGGPSRELFFLLSRELFNPYYGLFEYGSVDHYTVQISPNSMLVDNDTQWFELAGRVLGLALLHRCLIDTFFSSTFYKMLLEVPVTLQDMEHVDKEFYRSLLWIRSNAVDESLELTFTSTDIVNNKVVEHELLPNGNELKVNDSNKEEFISLMIKWRLERGIERQSKALLRGLHQIIDRDFLHVFTPDLLELVLSGTVEINLDDWRANTEYRGGYYDDHVVIEWFWCTVEQMTNAERLKLLQFVTGTSSVPFEGFSMLRGSNGLKRFTIEKWGDELSLPRAHTCFNRLDLPSYPTRHIMRSKLYMAINEGINYAIE